MRHPQLGVAIVVNKFFPLLQKTSRSFYLTIRLLPRRLREPVALAYLLARASDTIADEGKPSHEERKKILHALQESISATAERDEIPELIKNYCRKNFSHPATATQQAEKELLGELPELLQQVNSSKRHPLEADAINVLWRTILEGQLLDLTMKGVVFTSAQRERYLYLVAGSVGVFWTKLGKIHLVSFSQESEKKMIAWGVSYGKGLQLINILRDAPVDREAGRFYFDPEERAELISQAHAYLKEGKCYLRAVQDRRFRYASTLPLLLGEETLALLARYPEVPFLKISRWKVLKALVRGLFSFQTS